MSRRASSLLLFLSIVAVVGFMFWLDRAASTLPTTVVPVLDEGAETVSEITVQQLASDPAGIIGSTGFVRSVEVADRLGRGAFSIRVDSATSFPVLLSPDLIQMGTEVYGQDVVTLHGHIFTFNDSIRSVWVSQEAVDAQNAGTIPASPSFMLADSLSFN